MFDFTKRKFTALSLCSQHKKCAEVLRFIYTKQINEEKWEDEWKHYCELMEWMNEPIDCLPMPKVLADHYHAHLKLAKLSKKEHHLLPAIRKGDRLIGKKPWPIAIFLDHIRSAHNVGSIIRTVEAFSLGSIYFCNQTPPPQHKQVQDTSMGAIDWVDCRQNIELSLLPRPIIALETCEEAIDIYQMIFPSSFTLVIGNEEYGCSTETLSLADGLVSIPMRGRKNSLNVANAFAIAAGEICRQRAIVADKGIQ